MRLGKKAKRGTRVKKLANGGNGDPLAPLQPKKAQPVQSPAGFPLYREDGELTPTPSTPFYTKTNLRGLYEGVPLGLQEATVVGRPGDSLQSIDSAVESLGMGVFGDYAQVEPETRKKFEQGVTDAINEGSKIAAIATSPLIAIGAGPLLGSGLSGYSQLANMPLVTATTAAGETTATVGNVLEAFGVGLSAEFLPQHLKDFADDPSLGNAAFLGLDIVTLLPFGMSALASYKQGLGATKAASRTPMQFPAVERNLVQTAVESAEVQNARLTMNTTIQSEISGIEKLPISPQEKEKAIHETLEFYNQYLSNPAALQKIIEHKNFLSVSAEARLGKVLGDESMMAPLRELGAPMPPFEATGAAESANRYLTSTPYFSRYGLEGNVVNETQHLLRTQMFQPQPDGAVKPIIKTFSNTDGGRKQAAEALLQNFRSGSESVRNAALRTIEEMKAMGQGDTRGFVRPFPNISARAEMVEGIPFASGQYSYDLTAQQLNMLNTLTPEEFLSTLVHETNHNMLVPFLDQIADAQIIEMHTITSTVQKPYIQKGFEISETTPVFLESQSGFRSADDQFDAANNFMKKYSNDPRINLSRDDAAERLQYLTLPHEVQARLFEIKKAYAKVAASQGLSFDDWMYNFNVQRANEGFEAWKRTKVAADGDLGAVEADMFKDIFVGNREGTKLTTLASVLNKTFFNPATVVGTGAVATQAAISGEEAPTINKRGGLVKKKRRGYRSV